MAGGMHRGRHGASLADRATRSRIGQPSPPADQSGDSRRAASAGHGQHCWVRDPPNTPGIWPGLLVEWRQREDGWRGRFAYTVEGSSGPVLVEAWLPANQLKQG